jgi:hypothetical protein
MDDFGNISSIESLPLPEGRHVKDFDAAQAAAKKAARVEKTAEPLAVPATTPDTTTPNGVTSGTLPEVTSAALQPETTVPSSAAPKAATGTKTKVAEKKRQQGFVPSAEACANVWQRSKDPHFSPGFTVGWKSKEYILTKFNSDEHGSITLLDQKTGKTQTVTPINAKGQIVGLSLVSAEVRTQNKALIKAFAQTKISKCALEPAQIVSEMQDKVFAPVKQIAMQSIAAQQKMQGRIKEILIANAELIRWARDEFGAQGRKVPVPGTPSYNEWLKENLTIELPDGTKELACTDRYVRKVMAALDKQLANILREKLELPPVPKPHKKKEQDREDSESESEILAEAAVRMTNTLLGTGSSAPEPMAERVKKAVVQAESIKEAIADGNYERIQNKPLPKANTPKALFNFLNSEYIDVLDAVFDPESEPEEFACKARSVRRRNRSGLSRHESACQGRSGCRRKGKTAKGRY